MVKYLERVFPIKCKGRDAWGREVLKKAIKVKVRISNSCTETSISADVEDCPYNTGGHGQRCKASHPHIDKIGEEGIGCPYAFDIPYALEKKR